MLVTVLVALLASSNFLSTFKNFVLLLLTVFVPWSAVNLVDYYLISKEKVDIPALYDSRGRYGAYNGVALFSYIPGHRRADPVHQPGHVRRPAGQGHGRRRHFLDREPGPSLRWCTTRWRRGTMDVPRQMIYPAAEPAAGAHDTLPGYDGSLAHTSHAG
ncbi:cytosine/purines uracil thiamine allantoin permease [Alicycliphilus sp. B1]|nr:cytosine/purines uracil thiamine allantoin permease [Alicycliphilus sp. B1]